MSEIKTSLGWLELKNYNDDPTDVDTTRGGFAIVSDSAKYYNGTSWITLGSGTGGIHTWDELYDNDKTLVIDEATGVTWTKTHASGDAFTLAGGASSTGTLLQFNQGGSGNDVEGTSDTWTITKAGVVTATGLTMADDEPITLGDNSDATIQWTAAGALDIAGATNFDGNMTIEAAHTLTIAGNAGSTVATITEGDMEISDGSLTITDGDNAETVNITNATVTTGNAVKITADAITDGSMLYLDNSGASLDAGFYINCNDDGTADFTVGKDGATTITTAVNSTKALTVTGIQTSENLVTFDNATGVIAADHGVLLLDAGGNVADGGNILRLEANGTPAAGSIGIEFVGAGKVMQGLYLDSDPTADSVAVINGGGALTNGNAVLHVSSDGALATGGNTFKVTTAGTPAAGAVYTEFDYAGLTDTNENVGVHIDASAKKVQALKIDAAPLAGSTILATSTGVIAADKATAEFVSNVSACNADSAVVRIHQDHTTGVANVLHLVQDDVSEPMIGFESTVGEGNAIEAEGGKTLTQTHFIKIDIEGVGERYIKVGTIAA